MMSGSDLFLPDSSTVAETPLHRADPRLKLLVCGGLAVAAFVAGNWQRLVVAGATLAVLLFLARCGPRWLLRTLLPLRWLLLFTLLLHLLLSPGNTLFGVPWLSRDGLVLGLLICTQLAMAALAAALLTMTASAEQTALACSWLLYPLARLGCPVHRWQELIVLVLHFVPVLREELQATAVPGTGRWSLRVVAWEERLLPLFDRLVTRADRLTERLATGKESLLPTRSLPSFRVHGACDLLLAVGGCWLVLGFLLVGS
jgi:energy-coupling factor transport system permease protein